MLKKGGKAVFLIVILAFGMFASATSVFAPVDCEVRNGACLGGETNVFNIHAATNAHAELFSVATYDYKVCCKLTGAGGDSLSNACGAEDARVTALSTPTNAHVERACETDYSSFACLSATAGTVVCSQKASCNS